MPIAAGISAVGSIGSSLIGSSAATSAANAQVQAQQQVLAMLQQVLGPVLQTGQGVVSQGQSILGSVLPALSGAGSSILSSVLGPLTSLLTPGPNQTATLSQIPGFQFAQDWGQKAVQNLGTTLGLGGNTLASGAQYATGLAQQGYGNIVSGLQNLLNTGTGALGTVGNIGQGVLSAGGNILTGAAGALAGGSSSALSSMGNAQAAGILGSANALSSGIGGLSNAALLYGLGSKLGIGGSTGGSIYGNPAWSSYNMTGLTA